MFFRSPLPPSLPGLYEEFSAGGEFWGVVLKILSSLSLRPSKPILSVSAPTAESAVDGPVSPSLGCATEFKTKHLECSVLSSLFHENLAEKHLFNIFWGC